LSQGIHTYLHKRFTETSPLWELGVRSHGDSYPRCRHRLYALWAVALAMGLRRGEALGLAWADVDLDGGQLTVRQALHRVDGQLRLDPVKTDASVAVLPIPAPLVNILRATQRCCGMVLQPLLVLGGGPES
jgi:integrase